MIKRFNRQNKRNLRDVLDYKNQQVYKWQMDDTYNENENNKTISL